jgi:hypothetical protein
VAIKVTAAGVVTLVADGSVMSDAVTSEVNGGSKAQVRPMSLSARALGQDTADKTGPNEGLTAARKARPRMAGESKTSAASGTELQTRSRHGLEMMKPSAGAAEIMSRAGSIGGAAPRATRARTTAYAKMFVIV